MLKQNQSNKKKLLYIVNVDWFFLSHRLPIALSALKKGYQVHLASKITLPIEKINQYGFIVHPINLHRSKSNIFALIQEFFSFVQLFKKIKPDIVHLVTIKPVLLAGIAARITKIPAVIASISGLGSSFIDNHTYKQKIRQFLLQLIYKLACGHPNIQIICQNKHDQQLIKNYTHLTDKHFHLIKGSGVDLDLFKPTKLVKNEIPIVLFASRLIADKGIYEFIQAAQLLKNKKIARFVLTGPIDSENPSSLKQEQIQSWVDQAIVEYWGYSDNMPQILAKSHLVVLPSYREGLPKILLEAASTARAIITTDVAGCRDAIIAGVSGLLVPVKNGQKLAQAIEYLLKNPKLMKKMGKAGRKLAQNNYAIQSVIDAHLAIYDKTLKS